MPSKWIETSLEDLCEISGGTTPSKINEGYWNGDIPWITPTDLKYHKDGINIINSSKQQITDEARKKYNLKMVPENSVIFSSRATIGKIGITEIPITTNQGFINFIPLNQILPKFLAFFLLHEIDNIEKLSGSTTFKEVSRTSLRKFKIPLPDIEEQRKIVSILEEIDDLRQKQRKAIELTRQMIPALFYEMFGDPLVNDKMISQNTLKNFIISVKSGFACGKSTRSGLGNILHLRPMNISSIGGLSLLDTKFIPIESLPDAEAFSIKEADVLFNNTNSKELVGKSCYVSQDLENTAFSNHITRIRTNPALDPFFLSIQLQTLQERGFFLSLCNKWIGQAGINNQKLLDLSIIVPPIELQKRFTNKAQECLTLLEHQEQSLQKLEILFETTLNRFFSQNTP